MAEGELPPWDDNRELFNLHRELHHYTSREGLKGILQTNSLWATHFSDLSDSSELFVLKQPFGPDSHQRLGKKGVVVPPQLYTPKVVGPIFHDLANFHTHRKEIRRERLAELRLYLARILIERSTFHV